MFKTLREQHAKALRLVQVALAACSPCERMGMDEPIRYGDPGWDDSMFGPEETRLATEAEAHVEWHLNAGVPIGEGPCPWDACDPSPEPPEETYWEHEMAEPADEDDLPY